MLARRIVVGMDFSRPAAEAARWTAQQLAPDAEFILVHIIEQPRTPSFLRRSDPSAEAVDSAARRYAGTRLHEMATFLSARNPRSLVCFGRAYDELIRVANELGADLIVVGPHGDRPRSWKMLGTTAERLVRASPVPVLVAAGIRHRQPQKLLVPVDDAAITPTLLHWVKRIADEFGSEVSLLHVLSSASVTQLITAASAATSSDMERITQVDSEMLGAGKRWLETIATSGFANTHVETIVAHGNAGDQTIETANEIDADLIVMGRSGSGRVIAALLGSTVSTVLHGAACPVLVITQEDHKT
jgi:nucleotide-binding universal stress UspA family protein